MIAAQLRFARFEVALAGLASRVSFKTGLVDQIVMLRSGDGILLMQVADFDAPRHNVVLSDVQIL